MHIIQLLRSYLWLMALASVVVLAIAAVPSIISLPGQDSDTVQSSRGMFLLTPDNVYYTGNWFSHVSVEILANLSSIFTGEASAYETSGAGSQGQVLLASATLTNTSYFTMFFPATSLQGSGHVLLYLANVSVASFQVHLDLGYLPLLLEAAAVAIPLLFSVAVWLMPVRPKWMIAAAIPVFIFSVAMFGHRNDIFSLLSSGIRVLSHVNPYVPSSALPVSLKWVYPPLFVGYSSASALIYHIFTGNPLPTNGALNYPGAYLGDNSDVWRALVFPLLPLYYLIIKVPMLLATFGTFFLLRDKFKLKGMEKLWLLNPFVILIGVAWGQMDILAVYCMALSIYYLRAGNTFGASAFASLGAAIKIFPIFLLPFILISSRRKLRDTLPIAFFTALALAEYAYSGDVLSDIMNLLFLNAQPHLFGGFVANGYTWQQLVPWSNFPPLLILVFIPFYTYQVLRFWKSRRDIVQVLIETFLLYYLTSNFVNPQYFIYIVLLFILAKNTKWALIFSAIPSVIILVNNSLTYFVNPYLSYNYLSSPMGQGEQLQSSFVGNTHLFVGMVIVATVIYFYRYVRSEGFHLLCQDLRRVLNLHLT